MGLKKYLWLGLGIITVAMVGCAGKYEEGRSQLQGDQQIGDIVSTYVEKTDSLKEPEEKTTTEEETSHPTEETLDILFKEGYEKAQEVLKTMTLEEKVGQMILARCPDSGAIESIKDYHLGGYVLFKRDFENKTYEEVKTTLASYQEASAIPMVLAVDEEGGSVVRISSNPNLAPSKFLSPQALDKQGGMEAIEKDTMTKVQLLKDLGITMNLAPVADISTDSKDYIYNRTIGKDAIGTAEYVRIVVAATQSQGISATLKHFPGYGGNVDTHTGIATDTRPYEVFKEQDWIPFEAGIEEGVHSVLVSHNIVEAIDKDYPASLSPKVHEELRETLGFNGIIMTDDLEMDAIKVFTDGLHPAVQAVLAGNDMVIVTDFQEAFHEMIEAVETNILSEEQIDKAAQRILSWKYRSES